MDTWTS
jgi:hypothetical protein